MSKIEIALDSYAKWGFASDGKGFEVKELITELGEALQQSKKDREDALSLLKRSKCPAEPECDGEGRISVQITEDEWSPEPCQFCYERDELIKQLSE